MGCVSNSGCIRLIDRMIPIITTATTGTLHESGVLGVAGTGRSLPFSDDDGDIFVSGPDPPDEIVNSLDSLYANIVLRADEWE